jgi:hypothetical protein
VEMTTPSSGEWCVPMDEIASSRVANCGVLYNSDNALVCSMFVSMMPQSCMRGLPYRAFARMCPILPEPTRRTRAACAFRKSMLVDRKVVIIAFFLCDLMFQWPRSKVIGV